jgi:hypothetical protein
VKRNPPPRSEAAVLLLGKGKREGTIARRGVDAAS